jgi:hypothetical protein
MRLISLDYEDMELSNPAWDLTAYGEYCGVTHSCAEDSGLLTFEDIKKANWRINDTGPGTEEKRTKTKALLEWLRRTYFRSCAETMRRWVWIEACCISASN